MQANSSHFHSRCQYSYAEHLTAFQRQLVQQNGQSTYDPEKSELWRKFLSISQQIPSMQTTESATNSSLSIEVKKKAWNIKRESRTSHGLKFTFTDKTFCCPFDKCGKEYIRLHNLRKHCQKEHKGILKDFI